MNTSRQRLLLCWAACSALFLALASMNAFAVDPKPPGKMAFQGFLTDSSGVARGLNSPANFTVTFRIYNTANAAAADAVWAESQVVTVDKGHFSVVLGEGTAIKGATPNDLAPYFIGENVNGRYLGITVNAENEITPRIQFLSAPFAHLSRYATELVGSSGTSILKVGPNGVGINLAANAAPATALDVNGTVTATTFSGAHSGNGSALTSLNGANIQNISIDRTKIVKGTLMDGDISDSAGIADTKLSTIKTAGKVADSALSANIPKLNAGNNFTTSQTFSGLNGYSSGLHLTGSGYEAGSLSFENSSPDGARFEVFVGSDSAGDAGLNFYRNKFLLTLAKNGNVGINNYNPIGAQLVVDGTGGDLSFGSHVTYGAGGASGINGSSYVRNDVTIKASSAIHAAFFRAVSDARVKNIQGRSDGVADLATLNRIEITDYTHKDVVAKGHRNQ